MTIDDLPLHLYRVFGLVFGLLWGSFLNVVIYRVPREMSVVRPASHCPACGQPVKPWHNVPVLSFLVLRGKASCCKAELSLRYPLVEAIGGMLSIAILEALVFRLPSSTPLWHAGAVYVANLALALGLVAAAFIDLEFMVVPDAITYAGTVLGIATSSFRSISFVESLLGAAIGFGVVFSIAKIHGLIRGGKTGMGLGDAKLLMLAGAWFGWSGALFVMGAGAIQGTIAVILILILKGRLDDPEAVKREREEFKAELAKLSSEKRAEVEAEFAGDPLLDEADEGVGKARVAFGPFLILATLECQLVGREVIGAYWKWMGAA